MDALRIHGKRKFRTEFNCRLICKQRVTRSIASSAAGAADIGWFGPFPLVPVSGGAIPISNALLRRWDGASRLVQIQTRPSVCLRFGSGETGDDDDMHEPARGALLPSTNALIRSDRASAWRPPADSGAQIPPVLLKYV